jgi:hypothetical protein
MAITLSLFCPSTFAQESSPLDVRLSINKVPKYRNQLELDFTVSSAFEPAMSSRIVVSSEDLTVLTVSPGTFDVPVGPAEAMATARVSLDKDGAYRIPCYVAGPDDVLLAEKTFFARCVQGNAMEIGEDQYLRLAMDEKARWSRSQADERANADLEALRANGLQIAIEKYPQQKLFPVQNDMGWDLNALGWDQYDQSLLDKAVSDPAYKEMVEIDLNPVGGDTCPSYTATYATLPPPQPACWNTVVQLNIKVLLYSGPGTGKCGYVDWPSYPIKGEIYFRNYVTNTCTSQCVLRTVSKPVDIVGHWGYIDCAGEPILFYSGEINTMAGMAIGLLPVEALKIFTKDDASGISAGTCHKDTIQCDGVSTPVPVWDSGSEEVYIAQAGKLPTDLLYEYRVAGYPFLTWEVIATVKHTSLDASIHPEKIAMYGDAQNVKNFWTTRYSAAFPADYLQYKACILDMDGSWTSSFEYNCISPIITVDDGMPAWGILPLKPLYHQAGHWLQYRMQNNQLSGTQEATGCAVLLSEDVAFSEGFAGWHNRFVYKGRETGQPEENEYTAYCDPAFFPDAIANPQKTAAFNEGFLGDMFDLYNNAVDDPVTTDLRYDDNGILIGWDDLHISVDNLSFWVGHPYDRLCVLLAAWAQSGKPLAGNANVCPLLTKYYLEDLCP